jgi:hypothetical protein
VTDLLTRRGVADILGGYLPGVACAAELIEDRVDARWVITAGGRVGWRRAWLATTLLWLSSEKCPVP